MTLTLPAELELEHHVNNLVLQGAYPSVEAVQVDAVKALVREQERRQIECLLDQDRVDERRIEQLLQEAEDSGDYTEMTADDWDDVEREGLGNRECSESSLAADASYYQAACRQT